VKKVFCYLNGFLTTQPMHIGKTVFWPNIPLTNNSYKFIWLT